MNLLSSYQVFSFQYFRTKNLQGKVYILFVPNQGCKNLWNIKLDQLNQKDSNSQHRKS